MFRVVVLGGIALTAGAVAVNAVGCGGSDSSTGDGASDTGVATDSFPHEGTDTSVVPDSFPREGPALIDSGVDTGADAASDGARDSADATDASDGDATDTFPTEGPPPPPDSGP